jgi:PBSX family phage terminase large subunit
MTSSPQKSEGAPDWQELLTLLPKPKPPPRLIDDAFKAQAAYLEDKASLLCVLCTRRAGKSYGAALRLLRAAYAHPGASCLYIALTRDSAKRILWKDVLKTINREMKLGAQFNETTLSMTLPNASVVYLLGADTDEEEKQKLLGQKYAEVVIDESASFSIDMHELVYGILKPAVADYRGSISLIGTPGNLKRGLYFDITKGQDPLTAGRWEEKGWSCHRWSAADNPHMAQNWADEIASLKAANPLIEETPLFQQHYLGRWVIDESKLVYRFSSGRNDGSLEKNLDGTSYVLGVDLGYDPDPSAFVVCAYREHDKNLYIVEASKETGLDVTAVAERIKELEKRYDFDRIAIDNANKQAVEEMKRRHGLALHAADKTGKADFIELMNGDFISGYIKLLPEAKPLADEYAELIWDDKSEQRKEHANCDNHCADAALYAWRHCYPYLAEARKKPAPKHGSLEWHEANTQRDQAALEAQMQQDIEEHARQKQEREEAQEEGLQFLW